MRRSPGNHVTKTKSGREEGAEEEGGGGGRGAGFGPVLRGKGPPPEKKIRTRAFTPMHNLFLERERVLKWKVSRPASRGARRPAGRPRRGPVATLRDILD